MTPQFDAWCKTDEANEAWHMQKSREYIQRRGYEYFFFGDYYDDWQGAWACAQMMAVRGELPHLKVLFMNCICRCKAWQEFIEERAA